MLYNWMFEDVNQALPVLAREVMSKGQETGSRNGAVKELMHIGITLQNPLNREVLVPARKAHLAAQIAETMWVLGGRNDIEWLSHYLPRAKEFSDDGETWRAGYGPRIRSAGITDEDQWAEVVEILRKDPLSRRAAISIWDPTVDFQPGKDIPCNDLLIFSSRLGYLDLHVTIRSNDLLWGWSGINAFEWSAMLEITAGMLGLGVGRLHFSTVSLHTYAPYWDKMDRVAGDKSIQVFGLNDTPHFNTGAARVRSVEEWGRLAEKWFAIEGLIREGHADKVQQPIDEFPDPMLQSWLRVLQWWWTGQTSYFNPIESTRLAVAATLAVQPPDRTPAEPPVEEVVQTVSFDDFVTNLHDEKHAAYGDSWKRRGEMLAILANIARKIDRLGTGASTADETSADTAIDLLVYLAKYHEWLQGFDTDGTESVNKRIRWLGEGERQDHLDDAALVGYLTNEFEHVYRAARDNVAVRVKAARVIEMANVAYSLAERRWTAEQAESLTEAMDEVLDEYRGADAD